MYSVKKNWLEIEREREEKIVRLQYQQQACF